MKKLIDKYIAAQREHDRMSDEVTQRLTNHKVRFVRLKKEFEAIEKDRFKRLNYAQNKGR